VFDIDCRLAFFFVTQRLKISFEIQPGKRRTRNSGSGSRKASFTLKSFDANEIKYHLAKETEPGAADRDDDDALAGMSFIAISGSFSSNGVCSLDTGGLDSEAGTVSRQQCIVVQALLKNDLIRFIDDMRSSSEDAWKVFFTDSKISLPGDAMNIAKSLLQQPSPAEANMLRQRTAEADACVRNKDDDYTLLVYPFAGKRERIEAAAADLEELSGLPDPYDDDIPFANQEGTSSDDDAAAAAAGNNGDQQLGKRRARSHFLTIRAGDFLRLDDGEYLNDTLIDFWMQWYVYLRWAILLLGDKGSRYAAFLTFRYILLSNYTGSRVTTTVRNFISSRLIFTPRCPRKVWRPSPTGRRIRISISSKRN